MAAAGGASPVAGEVSGTHLDLLVRGSRITRHSFTSPNWPKYSRSPSVTTHSPSDQPRPGALPPPPPSFAKLENMLQNSVYVNFLLTGLVAQLACHPQPLLRSFLLNTNMVFQPSVKSLLQVCDACMHGCVQAQWWARPTTSDLGWAGNRCSGTRKALYKHGATRNVISCAS